MSFLMQLGDAPFLLRLAAIAAALTVVVCITLGRRIARKHGETSRFICGIVVPLAGFAFGFLVIVIAPEGPPPNDAAAMAAAGIWMFSVLSFPITMLTSVIVFSIGGRFFGLR
jgi:hypothetical protein